MIPRGPRRRASALLIVIFLVALTTPLICMLLDAHAGHVRCTHNHVDGTVALYVAQAGVHDAIGELLANPAWRTGFTDKPFTDDLAHSYTVALTDGTNGEIVITSTATTSRGYTRTVTATVAGF